MYHIAKNDPKSWEQKFVHDLDAYEYAAVLETNISNIEVWVDKHSDAYSNIYIVKWAYK